MTSGLYSLFPNITEKCILLMLGHKGWFRILGARPCAPTVCLRAPRGSYVFFSQLHSCNSFLHSYFCSPVSGDSPLRVPIFLEIRVNQRNQRIALFLHFFSTPARVTHSTRRPRAFYLFGGCDTIPIWRLRAAEIGLTQNP